MSALARHRAVWRVATSSAVRSAARPSAGFYVGLLAVVAFVSAGNGLSATDVVRAIATQPVAAAFAWFAWLVAALPVARAVLEAPGRLFLRSLPVPVWVGFTITAVHLALAELPWIALFLRGGSLASALGAGFLAIALHASLVAGLRRAAPILCFLASLGVIFAPIPAPARAALGLALAAFSLRVVERALADRGASARTRALRGPPVVALLVVQLRILLRSQRSALARGALFLSLGTALAWLAIRNNALIEPSSIGALVLGVACLVTALVAGSVAPAVRAVEASLHTLAAWTGTDPRLVRRSGLFAIAIVGAIAGLILAIAVGAAIDRLLLIPRLAALGAVAGASLGVVARAFATGSEADSTALLERLALVAVPAALLPLLFGEATLAGVVLAVPFALTVREDR